TPLSTLPLHDALPISADAVQPLRLSTVVPRPLETEANVRTYPTPASGPEEAAELPHRGGRFDEPAWRHLRGLDRLLQPAAAAGRAAPRSGQGRLLAGAGRGAYGDRGVADPQGAQGWGCQCRFDAGAGAPRRRAGDGRARCARRGRARGAG